MAGEQHEPSVTTTNRNNLPESTHHINKLIDSAIHVSDFVLWECRFWKCGAGFLDLALWDCGDRVCLKFGGGVRAWILTLELHGWGLCVCAFGLGGAWNFGAGVWNCGSRSRVLIFAALSVDVWTWGC